MEIKLTISDLAEVSGFSVKRISRMCETGTLKPVAGGAGHGSYREFDLMQSVVLRWFRRWPYTGRGDQLIKPVLNFLADLGEAGMLREFSKGKTHLCPIPYDEDGNEGPPCLLKSNSTPDVYRCFNLRIAYMDTMQRIATLTKEASEVPGSGTVGRSRGSGLRRPKKKALSKKK